MLRSEYRDDYGTDAKRKAQKNLAGRTHYVDDDTLRYFRARILACRIHDDGTLLSIVESISVDMDHSSRAFRAVVFNMEGTVIFRPDLEHAHKTRKSAENELWQFLTSFNGVVASIDDAIGDGFEITPDDYSDGQRITFDTREEAASGVAFLVDQYPGSEWSIISVKRCDR